MRKRVSGWRLDDPNHITFADVVRNVHPTVLIGTSASGLLDIKTTPLDPVIPGVEVHAQILENLLTNTTLRSPNYAIGAELAAAFLFGGLALGVYLSPRYMGAE